MLGVFPGRTPSCEFPLAGAAALVGVFLLQLFAGRDMLLLGAHTCFDT